MATPCRKCGATKTEVIQRNFFYSLAKKFGYRLRVCSRCRRLRLLHLNEHPDEPMIRKSRKVFAPAPLPVFLDSRTPQPALRCPHCGSTSLRRSRRRWHERLVKRSPMARCNECQNRFPLFTV